MAKKQLDSKVIEKLTRGAPQRPERPLNEGTTPSTENISRAVREANDPKRVSGGDHRDELARR